MFSYWISSQRELADRYFWRSTNNNCWSISLWFLLDKTGYLYRTCQLENHIFLLFHSSYISFRLNPLLFFRIPYLIYSLQIKLGNYCSLTCFFKCIVGCNVEAVFHSSGTFSSLMDSWKYIHIISLFHIWPFLYGFLLV